MKTTTITTEGVYTNGIVIPEVKPAGRRKAIVTFLPTITRKATKSDEEIWKEIEPTARRIRRELFKRTYPDLYEKIKKKSAKRKAIKSIS